MNSYEFTRNWFDWCFENPDKVNANDTALFMWLIEKNNRCGWSEKFSVTSTENMYACGFKTYPPYKKAFDRLVEFGFILIVKKSLNQYQTNIIAISKNNKATKKALDKASLTQSTKHLYSNQESNSESTFDINKQVNKEQVNQLEKRSQIFKESIFPYVNTYSKDLCEAFFLYWSEPNQTKTKMRFELQKTWDTSRRLKTWSKNGNTFDKNQIQSTVTRVEIKPIKQY